MKHLYLTLLALCMSLGLFAQSITVTQPNGGELLYGCQTYQIKWTSSGVSNYYDIHYSLDGGTIWAAVATNVNITNNQYDWTVPMATSSTVLVRVMDHSAPAKRDSSNGFFTINLPINVTIPNGGEVWQGLSSHLITWSPAGTSGIFNVYYSINSGSTWTSIATNIAANNYTWNVPNNPSTQALIKVQDATTSCQLDLSNAVFEISPAQPILTAPNGGEVWTITSNRNITWNTTTFHTNVKLEYSTDNGATYNLITASTTNSGTYTWNIPNTPTTQALVRASNATGSTVNDVSNAIFTIQNPGDFLTSPNGGETWRSGNTYPITWDNTAIASNVKLEYSVNSGSTWNQIVSSTSNTGSYNWTIPQILSTSQALVRIIDLTVATIMDTSDAVFTIKAPVTVDYPTLGTTLTGCSTIPITWSRTTAFFNYNGYDSPNNYRNTFELYYNVNGGAWNYITTVYNTNAQTDYSYNWTVPDVTPESVKIMVIAKYNTYTYGSPAPTFWQDSSDVASNVVDPAGNITVTNPNGGVTMNALTNYNITWTASGSSGYFDVLYSFNGGTSYNTIVSNISGNSYNWNVANIPSSTVLIKVRDNQNNCRKDISNASNTIIAATPILTSPNGGEVWNVNSTHNITWTTNTFYSTVYIEYSTDNGSSWNIISANAPNSGSFSWILPNITSTQALVRISNVGEPGNFDVSNAVFTIQYPNNFLTSPNGGETWRSLNTHPITWDNTAFTSAVKLEYSINNGSTWSVITNSATNSGNYSWSIPTLVTTTNALVRITNTAVTSITDVSNAVFTIKAPVTVDYPNTAGSITGCSIVPITWSRTNTFTNYNNQDSPSNYRNTFELYYNVNGGAWNFITSVSNTNSQTDYSYNWTVPDVTPESVKILIIAKYNTYLYGSPAPTFWQDSSDVASNVVDPSGTITVTNPNGGVTMNALTNYNITWTASGTSGYFDLLYSVNGGTSYSTIISNISGSSYIWNVANNPSSNVLIKVRDNQNNCRKDISNTTNTIQAATPILTSPNGNEIWKVNSSQNITWTQNTLYTSAFIEYSIDNGASWNIVVNSTPNTGSYAWTVPNTVTTQALIRISNVGEPANFDVSNAVFTINLPTPMLTTPNGGETWRSLNTHAITWDQSTVASNVKIEYSINNGSTWNTITTSTSNTGSYNWAIPSMLTTTQALVRITNTSFPTAIDTSNAVFTIKAPVTVDYPNTAGSITGCSTIPITWSRTNTFTNYNNQDSPSNYRNTFELYYNVNGGAWNFITSVSNTNLQTDYSYNWVVPDVTPNSVKILVIAKYNTYSYGSPAPTFWQDSSDVASNVVDPSGTITVTNPNGGVTMNALTNYNITWTASGTSGYFDLLYSVNGGTSYSTIISNISGSSNIWNVANNPSSNVLIKVRDNQNNCRKDISNAPNTIQAATPILTSPNGGEVWNVNSTHNITWTTNTLYSTVFIEYSTDNGSNWNIVTAAATNNGSYSWIVPNTVSTQALVRISNVGEPANFDVSNAVFEIQPATDFLTSPNGGEIWRSLNTHPITWDNTAFTSAVKLEYSINNGSTWNVITTSATNSGSYNWAIPSMLTTTTALIRITNTTVTTITDVSNAVFTIKAPVTVDYPNTAGSITGCSIVPITWSRTNTFTNYNNQDSPSNYRNTFELYYNVNGGAWNLITSVSNTNSQTDYSYNWTVPDVTPNAVKILVIAKYNTYSYGSPAPVFWQDSSDVASNVVDPAGTIVVTNPNGGVNLNALTNYNVTWTGSGTSGFYDVLYSVNGGLNYTTLTTNITGNTYTWNVNNNPSTNVLVKVRDNQNNCRKDISDATNTIVAATPVLTSPNGGETWNVNSVHNITWNTNSLYGPVCLEYSIDNGSTWNFVVTSTSNTGSYAWTLPYTPTNYAKIRISNVGNPSLYDVSDNVYTILVPTPVVTAPNGGETWYAGAVQNITWLPATYFSSVNIEYSLDNGSSWVTIATNQTNSGSYAWTLPSLNSASALIKVSNNSNPSVYDVSNALFTLRPWVRLITPNGGDLLGSCTQTTITFERSPSYSAYNIEYSVDNGSNWITLQTNTTYSNTFNNYNWTIPNNPSTQTLVRVYPFGNVARGDQSDAVFTIKKPVTIIQPNYGGVLVIGSSYPVRWQSDGISNIYDLAFSSTGPTGPWTNIVIGYNTSLNTYNWTVPNTPTTNAYLRIRDNVNSCKEDISDLAFTIASSMNPITVTAPNGTDTLHACTATNITWTESGAPIGNYNISYSIDYGTNWIPIASNYLTVSGSYNWVVPNINVPGALIRVQSGLNPLVYDYSNALFAIVPGRLTTSNDATICSGNSVQLNTTGGSNYAWSPSAGLSNPGIPDPIATPANTTLYIVSSVNGGCSLSDTVLITVIPSSGLTADVNIAPSTSTAICNGTGVLFTATPVNGGAIPVYQWKKNGANVGSNTYTYFSSALVDGDVITCVMTSSEPCMSNNPATSNAITMTVFPNTTPTVSITTPLTSVCAGSSVTFSANATNEGASPVYQWKKNGGNTGSNSSIFIDNTLVNSDVISLEMTSNASCVSPATVTSNSILMTVNPNLTPTVTITTPLTTVCSGSTVTFTANVTNAGATPTYQWNVNGTNTGPNSNTFATAALLNNSSVTCIVTASSACNTVNPVTSNALVMTVSAAPAAPVATSNSPVALNGTLNLFASTITSATYTWTGPNSFSSTAQNPVVVNATPAMNGTYSVYATVGGCSGPAGTTVISVSGAAPVVNISGAVQSELGQKITGVKVKLSGTATDSLMTIADGAWDFDVSQGSSYVVTPTKNNDVLTYNGITTLDIVLMQRHILGVQTLSSPYRIIAADVNSSQTVTTLDIVLTKSLILQNTTSFPGSRLWSFVNADYSFSVPTNPFPFEASRSYSSASALVNQHFIGCKLGDVNCSWDPLTAKEYSATGISFSTSDQSVSSGEIISIPVRIKDFSGISGFQYTLTWNPEVLEFVGTDNASLQMDFGTSQTTNGKLAVLWSTELPDGVTLNDGSVIFEVRFRVTGSNGNTTLLAANGSMIATEAVNNNLEILDFTAVDGLISVAEPSGIEDVNALSYALLQNVPNPFGTATAISFNLPVSEQATLSIFDMHGRLIFETSQQYAAGYHTVNFEANGLADGTYYYKLLTPNYAAVRKMVLIK